MRSIRWLKTIYRILILITLFGLVLLTGLGGCVSVKSLVPTEEQRANFGKVALVALEPGDPPKGFPDEGGLNQEAAAQMIRDVLNKAYRQMPGKIHGQIMERAEKDAGYNLVSISPPNLSTDSEKTTYRNLNDQGINTVLEIFQLPTNWATTYSTPLNISYRVRLINVNKGLVIYQRVLTYDHDLPPDIIYLHKASELNLLKALQNARNWFAETIVEEVFLLWQTEF